jgi:hypothetical protein
VLFQLELERGIGSPEIYHTYFNEIEKRKQTTLQYLDQAIAEGKVVAGYGASTTTTTLIYHFELGSRLQFIVDDNPVKHGLFSPGWHIPILPSNELASRKPDVVVILAWMYSKAIVDRHQAYINAGGKFLIPLPDMSIVEQCAP